VRCVISLGPLKREIFVVLVNPLAPSGAGQGGGNQWLGFLKAVVGVDPRNMPGL